MLNSTEEQLKRAPSTQNWILGSADKHDIAVKFQITLCIWKLHTLYQERLNEII